MKLKFYRENNKFTQKDIAKILGKNRVTIARWEAGNVTPRLETIIKLAKLYNCTTDDLIFS